MFKALAIFRFIPIKNYIGVKVLFSFQCTFRGFTPIKNYIGVKDSPNSLNILLRFIPIKNYIGIKVTLKNLPRLV